MTLTNDWHGPAGDDVVDRRARITDLREKGLQPGDATATALSAIEKAEEALQALSVNFNDWMAEEAGVLSSSRDAVRVRPADPKARDKLFEAAHDLKGQAGTLGYPLAAEVCASLCRLLESCGDRCRIPPRLIDQHVDAVCAMVRERAMGEANSVALALSEKLGDVTEHFIASCRDAAD